MSFCEIAYSQPGGFEGLGLGREVAQAGDLPFNDRVKGNRSSLYVDSAGGASGTPCLNHHQAIRSELGDLARHRLQALPLAQKLAVPLRKFLVAAIHTNALPGAGHPSELVVLDIRRHEIQAGLIISSIERLVQAPHDLHVLLRHRPRSIALPGGRAIALRRSRSGKRGSDETSRELQSSDRSKPPSRGRDREGEIPTASSSSTAVVTTPHSRTRTARQPAVGVRSRKRDGEPQPTIATVARSSSRTSRNTRARTWATSWRSNGSKRRSPEQRKSLRFRCASRACFASRRAVGSSCIGTRIR